MRGRHTTPREPTSIQPRESDLSGKHYAPKPSSSSSPCSLLNVFLLLLCFLFGHYIYDDFTSSSSLHRPSSLSEITHMEIQSYEKSLESARSYLRGRANFGEEIDKARNAKELVRKIKGEMESSLNSDGGGRSGSIDTPPPPPPPPPPPQPTSETTTTTDTTSSLKTTTPSGKKHVAIGMAKDISDAQLVVFIATLREYSPSSSSDIVLFMNKISEQAREIFLKFEAVGVIFDEDNLQPQPELMKDYHPSTYRWPMIKKYFDTNGSQYDKVLLADVRDMAFQADPFEIVDVDGLFVFNGVESMTIGEDGWNGGWVKDCFGQQVFQDVYTKPIICSGVSVGTSDAIYDYVDKMAATMTTAEFAKCERNGVDQGVHNVLLHTGKITTPVHQFDQRSGPVANMQAHVMDLKSNFDVVNKEGKKVAIMHQYDRYETLTHFLFQKYVYWDMTQESAGTGKCAGYILKDNVEAFKGRCDLSHEGPAKTPEDCCDICNRWSSKGCRGFTHIRAGCWLKTCSDVQESNILQVAGSTGGWLA